MTPIALLALLAAAMATLSAIGAERNFSRSLERRDGASARR